MADETRNPDRSNTDNYGPVRITGFVSHFVYKGTTKGNFEKPQKFNEFSKLKLILRLFFYQ